MAKKRTDAPCSWGDYKTTTDPLKPSLALLVKLGSALVHADEFFRPNRHELDKTAYDDLMRDAEVKAWIDDMTAKGLLPVKR